MELFSDSQVKSGPPQTSQMESFETIVNSFKIFIFLLYFFLHSNTINLFSEISTWVKEVSYLFWKLSHTFQFSFQSIFIIFECLSFLVKLVQTTSKFRPKVKMFYFRFSVATTQCCPKKQLPYIALTLPTILKRSRNRRP